MFAILRNLTIQFQLTAAMAVIALVMVGAAVVAVLSADSVRDRLNEVTDRRAPAIFNAIDTKEALMRVTEGFRRLADAGDDAARADADAALAQALSVLEARKAEMFGAQAGAEALVTLETARAESAAAVAARIAAQQRLDELWSAATAAHERASNAIVTKTDEATFDLVLAAEGAKDSL
ncbi:MAG: hypothetical protein AAFR16_05670, partial [Pseudomonadota bacterium]